MNNRTIILTVLVAVSCLFAVPILSDSVEATDHTYSYSFDVELGGVLNVTAEATFSPRVESNDGYTYQVDKPDWVNVEKGDGGGATGAFRLYTLTGEPESSGTFTVTITESWNSIVSGHDPIRHITTITINVGVSEDSYAITFDAKGGEFSDGSSTMVLSTMLELTLPSARYLDDDGNEIRALDGWYDQDGNLMGRAGETIRPTESETYYAKWVDPQLEVSPWDVPSNQNSVFDYSPTVKDEFGNVITDFEIDYYDGNSSYDETDCIEPNGNSISADFHGLMPGSYAATFTISATGYESTTWVVNVNQANFVIDDPEGDYPVGTTFERDFAVKPNNARISSYQITLDGSTAISTQYDISTSGTYLTFTAEEAGLWSITVTFSAGSNTPYNYTFYLTYYEDDEPDPEPVQPSIGGIHVNKMTGEGMDNVFMFSAYDVLNATRYEWDFGDGTTGQGSSVTHTYDNIDEYTVRCTVYNGDLSASAEITVFAEDIPTDDDFLEQANINSLYHQTFYIDIGTPLVTITGVGSDGSTLTQSQLEWLSYEIREINDRYVFDISGTCTDVTLVGSVITVTVTGGSQEWTWEITVYQEVDSGDVPSRGYAEYVLSGNIVTLTNLDPSDNGIRLVVDWGDGTQTKNGSGATFTHEYTSTGQKIIHLTWYISEMGSETQLTATLTVNIAGSPGTVVYVGGDGAEGSMDIQSGSSSYVIQECGFTKDGATFLGWNSSPDFKGTTFMPGETVSPNGTLTLYAMWSVDNSSSWLEDHILVIVATVLIAAMLLVIVVRRFL